MAYKYMPLEDPSHIRILVLRDQPDSEAGFQCSIGHVELSATKFSALSYTWGSPEKPFEMRVIDHNGDEKGYVPLTKFLHNALGDLRDFNDIQPKIFWEDQICINQENEKEKAIR